MVYYSRRHYRAVSPPADTLEQVRERIARNRALERAREDRAVKYPIITPENFDEACKFQDERIAFHLGAV